MYRKCRLLLILIILLSVLVTDRGFAAEKVIDIDQALELALTKNLDLKIAEINLANARIDYQKNKTDNLLTNSTYNELQGELAFIQAEDKYLQEKDELIIQIYQQYFKLNELEKEIELKTKETELKKRKIKEIAAEVEIGQKNSLDLFVQQNKYQTTLLDLERIKDDYQQFLKEFKDQLGIDQDSQILIDPIREPEIWEIEEDRAVEEGLNSSSYLKLKEKELNLAEVNLEKAAVIDTPKMDFKKAENSLKLARLNYEKEVQMVESSVQRQYYLYKQAVKSLKPAEQSCLQEEENYKIIKEQETVGLVTKNDLLSAEVNSIMAEYNQLKAITSYYLNLLKLQQVIGFELGVK